MQLGPLVHHFCPHYGGDKSFAALQRQIAVSAYLKSGLIQLFVFVQASLKRMHIPTVYLSQNQINCSSLSTYIDIEIKYCRQKAMRQHKKTLFNKGYAEKW